MNHIFPNRESRTAQETAQEQRHLGGEEFGDPPVEVNGEQPPGARAEFAPLPQVVNPRSFYGCGRVVDLR